MNENLTNILNSYTKTCKNVKEHKLDFVLKLLEFSTRTNANSYQPISYQLNSCNNTFVFNKTIHKGVLCLLSQSNDDNNDIIVRMFCKILIYVEKYDICGGVPGFIKYDDYSVLKYACLYNIVKVVRYIIEQIIESEEELCKYIDDSEGREFRWAFVNKFYSVTNIIFTNVDTLTKMMLVSDIIEDNALHGEVWDSYAKHVFNRYVSVMTQEILQYDLLRTYCKEINKLNYDLMTGKYDNNMMDEDMINILYRSYGESIVDIVYYE